MKKSLLFLVLTFCGLGFLQSQISVNLTWANTIGGINPGDDIMNASVVDAAGNLYITGKMSNDMDFDPGPSTYTLAGFYSAYFAKYDAGGNFIWAKVITGGGVSEGKTIGVDGSGNVYIAGQFNGAPANFDQNASNFTLTPSQNDMFIAKYTSAGAFVWAQQVGALSSNVNAESMKVTSAGDVILGGSFMALSPMNFNTTGPTYTLANLGSNDGFVAKYNTAGLIQWGFSMGDQMGDYVHAVEVDAANNIYIAGDFQTSVGLNPAAPTTTVASQGLQDAFFAKYNSTGTLLWSKVMGGILGDGAFRMKLDNTGDILLTGYMASLVMDGDPGPSTTNLSKVGSGSEDIFLGKYSGSAGNLVWVKNTGGNNQIYSYALTNDQQNNIYLAGSFNDVTDLDFTAAVSNYTPITTAGASDVFLAKYNSSGNMIFAHNMGGGSLGNGARGVSVDNANNIVLTGMHSFSINVDFVSVNNLYTFGGADIFMVKYNQCIDADTPTLTATSVSMCANGVATLSIAGGNLNSATTWVWSSLSCGSSTIATGTTATVSPVFLTTYFVRGEGGCTVPGLCASASVSVTPSKEITGLVTTGASTPVAGYVILYRYEGALTKWDSVTYQNINATGNYTFNAVNSTSYILMALPTASSLQTSYAPNAIAWKGATIFSHGCNNNTTMNVNVIPITDLGGGPGILSGKITEGAGYGNRGGIFAPGNPIGGLNIKGGKNPGGNIVAESRTNSSGEYTLSGLPMNAAGENYFIIVDIPGLDTNGTFRRAVVTGSLQYTDLDFVVDSQYVNPIISTGIKEISINKYKVTVYPNPTKDLIHVSLNAITSSDIEVEIIDVFGRTITTNRFINVSGQFHTSADMSALSKGIYFVRIRINSEESRLKIVLTD